MWYRLVGHATIVRSERVGAGSLMGGVGGWNMRREADDCGRMLLSVAAIDIVAVVEQVWGVRR